MKAYYHMQFLFLKVSNINSKSQGNWIQNMLTDCWVNWGLSKGDTSTGFLQGSVRDLLLFGICSNTGDENW